MEIYTNYFASLINIPTNYYQLQMYPYSLFNIFNNKYEVSIIKNTNKIFSLSGFTNNIKNSPIKDICINIEEYNNGLFNTTLYSSSKTCGYINLLYNDNDKILYICKYFINTDIFAFDNLNMYGTSINKNDEKNVKKILFGLAENIAIINNCNKICLDIDSNLKYYKYDNLKELGFQLTKEKSKNGWIVTEKIINFKQT